MMVKMVVVSIVVSIDASGGSVTVVNGDDRFDGSTSGLSELTSS